LLVIGYWLLIVDDWLVRKRLLRTNNQQPLVYRDLFGATEVSGVSSRRLMIFGRSTGVSTSGAIQAG
jgi:hypothetical protein